jgi:hypothetical protein
MTEYETEELIKKVEKLIRALHYRRVWLMCQKPLMVTLVTKLSFVTRVTITG